MCILDSVTQKTPNSIARRFTVNLCKKKDCYFWYLIIFFTQVLQKTKAVCDKSSELVATVQQLKKPGSSGAELEGPRMRAEHAAQSLLTTAQVSTLGYPDIFNVSMIDCSPLLDIHSVFGLYSFYYLSLVLTHTQVGERPTLSFVICCICFSLCLFMLCVSFLIIS